MRGQSSPHPLQTTPGETSHRNLRNFPCSSSVPELSQTRQSLFKIHPRNSPDDRPETHPETVPETLPETHPETLPKLCPKLSRNSARPPPVLVYFKRKKVSEEFRGSFGGVSGRVSGEFREEFRGEFRESFGESFGGSRGEFGGGSPPEYLAVVCKPHVSG
jgi:hypothetical protein